MVYLPGSEGKFNGKSVEWKRVRTCFLSSFTALTIRLGTAARVGGHGNASNPEPRGNQSSQELDEIVIVDSVAATAASA